MTELDQPQESVSEELEDLKRKADLMGITYSPRIGVDALRAKIREVQEASTIADSKSNSDAGNARREALRLIRCIIHNNDPAKNGQAGTIITAGSSDVGIVRKYVPFRGYPNGYHIPKIIYDFLMAKQYCYVWQEDNPNYKGAKITKSRFEPEYSITVLPPLTQEELDKLAESQRGEGLV